MKAPGQYTAIQLHKTLNTTRDFNEFKAQIGGIIRRFGFGEHILARLSCDGQVIPFLCTVSNDVWQSYQQALQSPSLIAQYIRHNNSPIWHSRIEQTLRTIEFQTDFTAHTAHAFEAFRQAGYADIYLMPGKASATGDKVFLAVMSQHRPLEEFHKSVQDAQDGLHDLSQAIDEVGHRKFPDFFITKENIPDIRIIPRPLAVLALMAHEDMSLQETADHFGRSVHTLNQQIAAVRKAFGTDTTYGAIYTGMIKSDA